MAVTDISDKWKKELIRIKAEVFWADNFESTSEVRKLTFGNGAHRCACAIFCSDIPQPRIKTNENGSLYPSDDGNFQGKSESIRKDWKFATVLHGT